MPRNKKTLKVWMWKNRNGTLDPKTFCITQPHEDWRRDYKNFGAYVPVVMTLQEVQTHAR